MATIKKASTPSRKVTKAVSNITIPYNKLSLAFNTPIDNNYQY
jgi:hypothetical protein